MDINCVVFDLWDTLIYFPNGWRAFNYLKDEFDIDANFWRSFVKPTFLCRHHETVDSFLSDFVKVTGIDFNQSLQSELMQSRLSDDIDSCQIYEDSLNVLKSLKGKGYNLGVISNQASFYEPCFVNQGLDQLIDYRVFSNRLGFRKPSPKIYEHLLAVANKAPKKFIMVGNNYGQDFLVPRFFGMKSLWLRRDVEVSIKNQISNLFELEDYLGT